MGGYQKYGPFLGTLNIRCRTRIETQKGTIILTSTHIGFGRDAVQSFGIRRLRVWLHNPGGAYEFLLDLTTDSG